MSLIVNQEYVHPGKLPWQWKTNHHLQENCGNIFYIDYCEESVLFTLHFQICSGDLDAIIKSDILPRKRTACPSKNGLEDDPTFLVSPGP